MSRSCLKIIGAVASITTTTLLVLYAIASESIQSRSLQLRSIFIPFKPRSKTLDFTANTNTNANALKHETHNQPPFDFYVLSMSFQPEFCYQHRRDGFPGCESPMDFWRSSLTLHGLWPQYDDGNWPSTCTNEKFDPETVDDIGYERFETFWPNVKALASTSASSNAHYSFWDHEWTKHGTCTGLTQDEYFDTALNHFLPTPNLVNASYGGSVSKEALEQAYREELRLHVGRDKDGVDGDDVVLVCSGQKYLSEVRVCVGRSKDGSGSSRIRCIPEVINEGNCGDKIYIAKFYIDGDDASIGIGVGVSQ
mmetsp:Transcript_2361/g.3519  ORF Transcript_2361/g.3519 Transcript_2361/m.3519 type:complete len:309 (+) Transcript_2361:116-1042(+)